MQANASAGTGYPRNIRVSALISAALVLPFVILELVNRQDQGFPVTLFGFLWLLPLAFILLLLPIVRRRPAGPMTAGNRLGLWSRIAVMGFIAWVWVSIVLDQMPCFLGVPNCD